LAQINAVSRFAARERLADLTHAALVLAMRIGSFHIPMARDWRLDCATPVLRRCRVVVICSGRWMTGNPPE
jgi:hypothetical protein